MQTSISSFKAQMPTFGCTAAQRAAGKMCNPLEEAATKFAQEKGLNLEETKVAFSTLRDQLSHGVRKTEMPLSDEETCQKAIKHASFHPAQVKYAIETGKLHALV